MEMFPRLVNKILITQTFDSAMLETQAQIWRGFLFLSQRPVPISVLGNELVSWELVEEEDGGLFSPSSVAC